jgi:hypothetical protein
MRVSGNALDGAERDCTDDKNADLLLTFLSTFLFSPFLARLSYAQTQTPATPVVATRTFGREATAGDSAATTNTLRNHAQ